MSGIGLAGQLALVTGAGSGVGRATAVTLAGAGASVVVSGRTRASLEETAALARQTPGGAGERVRVAVCDVTVPAEVERMVGDAMDAFGRIDVLVNNAGFNVPRRALDQLDAQGWRDIMNTNLDGAFLCVHAVLPIMRAQQSGTFVHIGSLSARRPSPLAGAAYTAAKAGLAALSATINAEEKGNGIRSGVIVLGDTNTPLLDKRPRPPDAATRAASLQPEDVADCILLIAALPGRAKIEELVLLSRELN
jgi:NAD(P)-dependent dehydrogenase (short-subunit alcohol dehydrogenase family)